MWSLNRNPYPTKFHKTKLQLNQTSGNLRTHIIDLLVIVQAWNSGFWISRCAPISLKHGADPEPPKKFPCHKCNLFFYRFNQSVQSPTRRFVSVWRRTLFMGSEQLNGSFSDIGAHQDFQMLEFFMPEVLLTELWHTYCKDTFRNGNFTKWLIKEKLISAKKILIHFLIPSFFRNLVYHHNGRNGKKEINIKRYSILLGIEISFLFFVL